MLEPQSSSQSWSSEMVVAGIFVLMIEILLGIVFLEQALSHPPLNFHYGRKLFVLLVAMCGTPLPWVLFRKGRDTARKAMLEAGLDANAIASIQKTTGVMFTTSYMACFWCVLALTAIS
jgi:hypothetical protein